MAFSVHPHDRQGGSTVPNDDVCIGFSQTSQCHRTSVEQRLPLELGGLRRLSIDRDFQHVTQHAAIARSVQCNRRERVHAPRQCVWHCKSKLIVCPYFGCTDDDTSQHNLHALGANGGAGEDGLIDVGDGIIIRATRVIATTNGQNWSVWRISGQGDFTHLRDGVTRHISGGHFQPFDPISP